MNIDNTSFAWSDAIRAMRDEAKADAAQRDSSTQLSVILDDLSRVLDAYATRLDGVERVDGTSSAVAEQENLADEFDAGAPQSLPPASEQTGAAEIPDWLIETLNAHHERISALEDRINDLEENAQLTNVSVSAPFMAETPEDPADYRPESWGSIERARQALSNRVRREHSRRAAIRQTVLNAVTDLATRQDSDPLSFSEDDRAQLRQQRARSDRLSKIDLIRDVKLDEIGALDDLEIARAYEAEQGWPD